MANVATWLMEAEMPPVATSLAASAMPPEMQPKAFRHIASCVAVFSDEKHTLFMTAAHVKIFTEGDAVRAIHNDTILPLTWIYVSETDDVAFAEADSGPFPVLSFATNDPIVGSTIICVSYPGDTSGAVMALVGRVVGFWDNATTRIPTDSERLLIHDLHTSRGASGSAIVDVEGRIVGLEARMVGSEMSGAVPLGVLLSAFAAASK